MAARAEPEAGEECPPGRTAAGRRPASARVPVQQRRRGSDWPATVNTAHASVARAHPAGDRRQPRADDHAEDLRRAQPAAHRAPLAAAAPGPGTAAVTAANAAFRVSWTRHQPRRHAPHRARGRQQQRARRRRPPCPPRSTACAARSGTPSGPRARRRAGSRPARPRRPARVTQASTDSFDVPAGARSSACRASRICSGPYQPTQIAPLARDRVAVQPRPTRSAGSRSAAPAVGAAAVPGAWSRSASRSQWYDAFGVRVEGGVVDVDQAEACA